jgi:hypothetical protein
VTRQFDPALEGLQRFFQRQVATLEPSHQSLKLRESFLEVGGIILGGQRITPLYVAGE